MKRKSLKLLFRLESLLGQDLSLENLAFLQDEPGLSEIDLLKEFSAIDSSTLNLAGVGQMQARVARWLSEDRFAVKTMRSDPRFGELIIAERAGRSQKFVTLITHSDTVLSNYREFKIDGDRAYGSGVIDNKGGLVVGLSAVRRFLRAHPETEYSLRFVCSPNEEMGSVGFTDIFRELGKDTVVAFGLEPALDNGSVIHQRRGNRWYDIEIKGQEAHAGRSRGEHANAAHDAAKKIAELASLTNYRKEISVNVGHVEGGKDRHNVICGLVRIKLDTRFPSMDSRDRLHRRIEKILAKCHEVSPRKNIRTETRYEIVDDCPPFSLTRHSKVMAAQYATLVGALENRKIRSEPSGGAGDVNYLSTPENFVLDGLGPVGGQMHTHGEFVSIPSLKTRAQALAGYLHYLQKRPL